jgi:ribonuclease P protein component
MAERFSFKKAERLSGKTLISKLFTEGKTISSFPLKIIYLFTGFESPYPAQLLVSVPKKNFKRAVNRNLIKRRIREAYRLNKNQLYMGLGVKNKKMLIAIIYTAHEITDYHQIEIRLKDIFNKLSEIINKQPVSQLPDNTLPSQLP